MAKIRTGTGFPAGSLPEVVHMGASIWDPVWSEKMHRAKNHELVYIINGTVTLHIDGKKYRAGTGDLLVVPAGVDHRDVFPADNALEALLIHFAWDGFDRVLPPDRNTAIKKLPRAEKGRMREMVLDLYRTFREERSLGRELAAAGLYRLLVFLLSAVRDADGPGPQKSGTAGGRPDIIKRVKAYIHENITRPIALADIAGALEMSSYHLSHVFSRTSGFTLSSYLIQVRMKRAATLLADPRMRVADVAYQCGFGDPNYFGKVFRKYYSRSPGQYRAGLK